MLADYAGIEKRNVDYQMRVMLTVLCFVHYNFSALVTIP